MFLWFPFGFPLVSLPRNSPLRSSSGPRAMPKMLDSNLLRKDDQSERVEHWFGVPWLLQQQTGEVGKWLNGSHGVGI